MRWQMVRKALIALDGFVALTAIGGGFALMLGLEGERFPLEMLQDTPFQSYVIPGLLLAALVGGSAAVAVIAMLRKAPTAFALSQLAGILLMGWIVGEIILLPQASEPTVIELFYFITGLLMVVGGRVLGNVGWYGHGGVT